MLPPTPPPDIDLEAWERSLGVLESWGPEQLCLTHFGPAADVDAHLGRLREGLAREGERARAHGEEAFVAAVEAEVREATAADEELAERYLQAAPAGQLYLGLERYWREKAEREGALSGGGTGARAPATRP